MEDNKSEYSSKTRNVTLALPKDLLRRVKVLAAERNSSVSGLLVEALRQIVERGDSYERAHRRWREDMKNPPDLGTDGKIAWTREELHERR